jgi:hypothetical protein
MSTLTIATADLHQAEINLNAARAVAEQLRRDEATKEVIRVRARIVELKPQLLDLTTNVSIAINRRLDLFYKIRNARQQIASWSEPLDAFAFPSAGTLADHAQQAQLWTERERSLYAEYAKVDKWLGPAHRRARAMKVEFETLGFQYANYLRVAEEGGPQSGLAHADTGFLSVPGSLDHVGFPAVTVPAPGMRRILSDGSDPKDTRGVWARLSG